MQGSAGLSARYQLQAVRNLRPQLGHEAASTTGTLGRCAVLAVGLQACQDAA